MYKFIKNLFIPEVVLTREEKEPKINQPIWTIIDLMKTNSSRFTVTHQNDHGFDIIILRDDVNHFSVQIIKHYVDSVDMRGRPYKMTVLKADKPWMNYHEVKMLHKAITNMANEKRQAHHTKLRNQVIEQYRS
jgi:hypothetical protein